MGPLLISTAILLELLAATPGAGAAAADRIQVVGRGAVTIVATPMSVGSALGLPLDRASPLGATMGPTQVIVTGESGQLYRVGVEGPRGYRITFWSVNSGDVSQTRMARLSAQGRDTLRIAVTPGPTGEAPTVAPPSLTVTISGE
jgi:hypothetical protein